MKNMTKTISMILIGGMILATLSSCRSKSKPVVVPESNISVETSSDPATSSEAEVQKAEISDELTVRVENSSKYTGDAYSLFIPDWTYLGDYYYENTTHITEQEDDITGEMMPANYYITRDFYSRGYSTANSELYLFVSEYLGNEKYFGSELTYGKTLNASATGISAAVSELAAQHFINSKYLQSFYALEPYTECQISSCYWFFDQYDTEDGYRYDKGYILVGLEHPIVVTFVDWSKDHLYDEEIEALGKEIINSYVKKG